MLKERTTKYTKAVRSYTQQVGHATNFQILSHLHGDYPELSATTVHRITARMVERGELAVAPAGQENAARFDANIHPHDHFQCLNCDRLRDMELPVEMFEAIQNMMGDCKLSGRLVVQGSCNKCIKYTEEKHEKNNSI